MSEEKIEIVDVPKNSTVLSLLATIIFPLIGFFTSGDVLVTLGILLVMVIISIVLLFMKQQSQYIGLLSVIYQSTVEIKESDCSGQCSEKLVSQIDNIQSAVENTERIIDNGNGIFDIVDLSDDNKNCYMIIISTRIENTYVLELKGKNLQDIEIKTLMATSEDHVIKIKPNFTKVNADETEMNIRFEAHPGTNISRLEIENNSESVEIIKLFATVICNDKYLISRKEINIVKR